MDNTNTILVERLNNNNDGKCKRIIKYSQVVRGLETKKDSVPESSALKRKQPEGIKADIQLTL